MPNTGASRHAFHGLPPASRTRCYPLRHGQHWTSVRFHSFRCPDRFDRVVCVLFACPDQPGNRGHCPDFAPHRAGWASAELAGRVRPKSVIASVPWWPDAAAPQGRDVPCAKAAFRPRPHTRAGTHCPRRPRQASRFRGTCPSNPPADAATPPRRSPVHGSARRPFPIPCDLLESRPRSAAWMLSRTSCQEAAIPGGGVNNLLRSSSAAIVATTHTARSASSCRRPCSGRCTSTLIGVSHRMHFGHQRIRKRGTSRCQGG